MEAILHSALLRRERVMLQHEAEFEQQGQLLFTYTESLFDILPIQPSNKRPRTACGLNFEQVPSCYDKENLVRPRKYSNEYDMKWQGTKEPHSRVLADKDPNIRVYDSSVKNLAYMATARAGSRRQVATLSVAEPAKCWNCQAQLRNADPEREVNLSTKFSVKVPVKTEVDEGAGEERHVSAPQHATHSLTNSNKKRSRKEGDSAIYVYEDKTHESVQNSENDIEERAKKAMVKSVDERSDQKLAREEVADVGVVEEGDLSPPVLKKLPAEPRGRAKVLQYLEIKIKERAEKAMADSVDERGSQCITGKGVSNVEVVEEEREGGSRLPVPKNKTAEPGKRGRPRRAAAASAATAQIPQRVTRAQARKHEPPGEPPRCGTTSELMSTSQPSSKSTAREEKKVSSVVTPGIEDPGAQLARCNIKPTTGTLTFAEGTSDTRRHQFLQGDVHDTEELKISVPCIQVLNAVSLVKERPSVITRVDHDDKDCKRYFMESKSFEMRDKFHTGGLTVLTEQDMYPDVTLTLDRWEYRKRMSPRSKARARRWKSDVALKGEDHVQGQPADEPTTSPDRLTSLEKNSVEVFACEAILQTPVAEMHKLATLGLSSDGREATNRDSLLQQMGLSSRQSEKVNSMPLLQSIYELRNACRIGMSSASKFLEEGEQRQVENLIASADRIVQRLSSKRGFPVGAVLKIPTPMTSTLNTSKSSDLGPIEAYPEKFNLLSSTCSPGEVQDSHPAYPSVHSFHQPASLTGSPAVVAPLLAEKNISTSTKHVNQVRLAESMAPTSDFAFSQYVNEAASGASPGHFRSVCNGQIPRKSDACKLDLSQKDAAASPSPPAVIPIIPSSSSTLADQLNPASAIVNVTLINSTSSTTVFQSQPGVIYGNSMVAIGSSGSRFVHPGPPGGMGVQGDTGVQSYEISPFRDSSDEDSEDEQERSQKPIPQWARKEHLLEELARQVNQDPDEIFSSASSCTLDEVFQTKGSKRRPDFKRRGSSGDWEEDCVTWQEEVYYKNSMGYLH